MKIQQNRFLTYLKKHFVNLMNLTVFTVFWIIIIHFKYWETPRF